MNDMRHMDYLEAVSAEDVRSLREKERTYRGSWKRRGGVGAFMMLARKWDRLESMLSAESILVNRSREGLPNLHVGQYDVFAHVEADPSGRDGSPAAEIRDLRRYLLLVESEMTARGVLKPPSMRVSVSDPEFDVDVLARKIREETRPGTPEDGGHHENLETRGVTPPHVLSKAEWDTLFLPASDVLYRQWHTDYFILETHLKSEIVESLWKTCDSLYPCLQKAQLRSAIFAYVVERDLYVLDARKIPREWRYLWPTLRRELNSKEYEDSPRWQQVLYRRDEEAAKWILQDYHSMWAGE